MRPSRDHDLILVVDDDVDLREAIQDALEQDGYVTAGARDGSDALSYLGANPPPALILLDWNMAPMNGSQFLTELAKQERYAAIPVVLLTADAHFDRKAKTEGVAAALKKPVRLAELFALVARYCGGAPAG